MLAVAPFTLELSQPVGLLMTIAMQLNKMEATDQQQLACNTEAYCPPGNYVNHLGTAFPVLRMASLCLGG